MVNRKKNIFPLVDALLLTPKQGKNGVIGVCTNTSAPGQVYNEIKQTLRPYVSVLGSLIVNRDGTERMILNSLAHHALKYLILFSDESVTFSPSINLLQVLKNGFDKKKEGNYIKDGKSASPQYPNLNEKIIEMFKSEIIVLPIFMSNNSDKNRVVYDYLEWLRPKIDKNLYELLKKIDEKNKIYYDSLNDTIELLSAIKTNPKKIFELDPKDFRNLQLPKKDLKDKKIIPDCPFKITRAGLKIKLDIKIGYKSFFIKNDNDFLIGYTLMKFLGKNKKILDPLEQLFLGLELGRVKIEIINNTNQPSYIKNNLLKGKKEIKLESKINLKTDNNYYYKVWVKKNIISVACLAYNICDEVFELRSKSALALIEKLAELNRFENYEMDILHRIDIGSQIARAAYAAKIGYNFIQDFDVLFKINTEKLPLIISDGNSFLDVHKSITRKIYTEGFTKSHGDAQKGIARTGIALAIFRDFSNSLRDLPNFYREGVDSTKIMRQKYKKQLLRFDHDGSYSYGERTRSFFGYDQLKNTIKILKNNPKKAAVIQRFDNKEDMNFFMNEDEKKLKFTHDPCLTHDIFFIQNNVLHSFHIARAHNIINAYPENIFGLYDAYIKTIQNNLKVKGGDMYMLSNRGNILLLTEEQKTRKILSEPSKPTDDFNVLSGPYKIEKNIKISKNRTGVFYIHTLIKKIIKKPKSKILEKIENYNGVNILDKAIDYLKIKGVSHNNPIISEYDARSMDPQGDYLLFFQANVSGKKLNATAVYVNHKTNNIKNDLNLCNYIATKYTQALKSGQGDLIIFYIN